MQGIALEYTQDRQFLYAKLTPSVIRRALNGQNTFETLMFEALEAIHFSSFAYQLDTQQLEDLAQMPWHTLNQTLIRRIAVRTEFTLKIELSPDKMEAKAQLKLAFAEEKVSEESLRARLAEAGIVAGILPEILTKWVENPKDDTLYTVARGQWPEKGQDEALIPLVQQVWVKAGDQIARHQSATSGAAGFDVLGNPLPARKGKRHPFVLGQHCSCVEDMLQVSEAGVLLFTPRLVLVSNPQRIELTDPTPEALQKLADLYESLYLVGDLKACRLVVTGHLWIEGNCENVYLEAGGHLCISGHLTGPSALKAGGCCWLNSVRESTLMVAHHLYAEQLHTTQAFVGQSYQGPRCEGHQLFLHPAAHPFFSQEPQRIQTQLTQINLETKACVQHLIEARKAQNQMRVTDLLKTYHRLQRQSLFLQGALSGYETAFDSPFAQPMAGITT